MDANFDATVLLLSPLNPFRYEASDSPLQSGDERQDSGKRTVQRSALLRGIISLARFVEHSEPARGLVYSICPSDRFAR